MLTKSILPDHAFLKGAKQRPMIFEVKRKVAPSMNKALHRFHISHEGSLGMTVRQLPIPAARGNYTFIVSVVPEKLASLYGLCAGDIICKPNSQGLFQDNVYSWFMDSLKNRRPFTFDVWRSPTVCSTTNPDRVIGLKKTDNPFVWSYGADGAIYL